MTLPDSPGTTPGQKIERTVEVQGIATHLFEAGATTAPPLLYLHGTHLGNLWLDYHQALARAFHVFAPDIPGFGLTERPDWMRDMDDYILYFRDLLNALDLERVALVGHSLGGWMAAEFAIWYPARAGRLVLSNPAGIRVKGTPMGNLFAMNLQEVVATCFNNPMAALALMPQEVNADYLVHMYKERTTLASLAWNPHFDPKLARRLRSLRCPTLILWGENDRLIPPLYGETFHALIPGSRLIKLSGTGHMPMFEQHEAWAQHITEFLLERQEANA